ncbi:MAG TPA: hypothetical protein VHE54_04550, partial [Puia sp.]|nr:hypothetical protein [Puia sp.]
MYKSFLYGGVFLLLVAAGIVSCRKEISPVAAANANSFDKKAATELVQGPPAILWWANGIA